VLLLTAGKAMRKTTDFAGNFVALVGLAELVSWALFGGAIIVRNGIWESDTVYYLLACTFTVNSLCGLVFLGIYCSRVRTDPVFKAWKKRARTNRLMICIGTLVGTLLTFKFFRLAYGRLLGFRCLSIKF